MAENLLNFGLCHPFNNMLLMSQNNIKVLELTVTSEKVSFLSQRNFKSVNSNCFVSNVGHFEVAQGTGASFNFLTNR